MRINNSQHVLQFWEEVYGEFKPVWKPLFLHHPAMKKILKYRSDQIMVAIRRNKKLDQILMDLENQSIVKETFDRKENPFYDANQGDEVSADFQGKAGTTTPAYKQGRVSKRNLRRDAKPSTQIAICASCRSPISRDNMRCKCS